jgi:NTE family protein
MADRPRLNRIWSWIGRQRSEERTAFVLAGGGSRGASQVGMLAELAERGIRADRVYGASVGAVNAVAYAADPTVEGVKRLEDTWVHLRPDDIFPKARVHGPWLFFQQRASVYANSGLRQLLESGLEIDELEDTVIPLEVVATSLTDGAERWFTTGSIVDAVLASAAIPGIFPPVSIDGEMFIDGGVVNNVPVSRAAASGATSIYVLLCGPSRHTPQVAKRPIEAVISALFTSVHARFAREVEELGELEVFVFNGTGRVSQDFRDFGSSPEMIEAGRLEVCRVLDESGPHGGHRPVVD